MLTLAHNAVTETSPEAVKRIPSEIRDEVRHVAEELSGKWLRVFPQTGRDVRFLQMTELHVDRFAPAKGHGVLLHPRCLSDLDLQMQ